MHDASEARYIFRAIVIKLMVSLDLTMFPIYFSKQQIHTVHSIPFVLLLYGQNLRYCHRQSVFKQKYLCFDIGLSILWLIRFVCFAH